MAAFKKVKNSVTSKDKIKFSDARTGRVCGR
jgi:hypothetical protein